MRKRSQFDRTRKLQNLAHAYTHGQKKLLIWVSSSLARTLYAYVNDAIGFRMSTEVVLYYSDRFFGTADAICFRNNKLRIHDLKTGVGPVHMEQLEVYAALFCLEYKVRPGDIEFELCIYQNDEVVVFNPTAEDILPIMDKIVHLDKILAECDAEEA